MKLINQRIYRYLIVLLCACLLMFKTTPVLAQATSIEPSIPDATNLFSPILVQLQMTGVPLRLPTYIPNSGQRSKDSTLEAQARRLKAYAVIDRATPNGYALILGYSPTCSGGNACRLGAVAATRKTNGTPAIEEAYGFMKDPAFKGLRSKQPMAKVQLTNQIEGYFIPWICGANCNDAKVVWDEKGVRYVVGIKVGDRDSLVAMANSAIQPRT